MYFQVLRIPLDVHRCGHCKKLEPEFEAAAKELAKGETGIVLAAVDATDDKNAALASKVILLHFHFPEIRTQIAAHVERMAAY